MASTIALWFHYLFFIIFPVFIPIGLFKGLKITNYLFARRSWPVWFLIVLRLLRFLPTFLVAFSFFCCFESLLPLLSFTTFLPLGCSENLRSFFSQVWLLVLFTLSDGLEILPTFFLVGLDTVISDSCGPVKYYWDFITFVLAGRDLCNFWYFVPLLGALRIFRNFPPRSCWGWAITGCFWSRRGLEILPVWTTVISSSFRPLRSLADFTLIFFLFKGHCDS